MAGDLQPKPVRWVGSSQEDLRTFPEDVRRRVGGALWDAQLGLKAPYAKPLKGFTGAGVLEVIDDSDGDTFCVVYRTVRQGSLCVACLPEEIETRHCHAEI